MTPGQTIHAIFLYKMQDQPTERKESIILAMETCDNQLDFSVLELSNLQDRSFNYQFFQIREVVRRDVRLDDIVKLSFIIDNKNMFYGIALRLSGEFDIYWNMNLIETPENGNSTA